ncbi:hypothetical protein B296_00022294 [Ensete ventricosum]|uniref:Selenoprotein F/M domain-containing protein n=1 Tax=Ensete ventricosum TaxID=4639 RepID=A0A427A3V2_ENSVE|nr:hypothetical protein B296_00022294 [Ensete ventricosum]
MRERHESNTLSNSSQSLRSIREKLEQGIEETRGPAPRCTGASEAAFAYFTERQMIRSTLALCFLLAIWLAGAALGLGERLGAKECEDLGFTGLALCSDCNTLAEYVKDEELVSDCRKCCSEDSDDSISKQSNAGYVLCSKISSRSWKCHGS